MVQREGEKTWWQQRAKAQGFAVPGRRRGLHLGRAGRPAHPARAARAGAAPGRWGGRRKGQGVEGRSSDG